MAGGFVVLAAVSNLPASAQFQIATAGRDYSFTISTAQPWTDTGVDLQTGDVLQIHSSPGETCDPAGVSGGPSTGLPVVSAPAGALIARLQPQGVPVLVGSGKQLKVEEPGHLFLGVNTAGAPPCSGNFAVKIHIAAAAAPTVPAAGNFADHGQSLRPPLRPRLASATARVVVNRYAKSSASARHQVEASQRRPGFSGGTIRHRRNALHRFFFSRARRERCGFPGFSSGCVNHIPGGVEGVVRQVGFRIGKEH